MTPDEAWAAHEAATRLPMVASAWIDGGLPALHDRREWPGGGVAAVAIFERGAWQWTFYRAWMGHATTRAEARAACDAAMRAAGVLLCGGER